MASIAPPFVPAWKRLGLKLKSGPSSPSTEPSASASDVPKRTKRKVDAITDGDQGSTPSLKRKKSVSFSAEATTLSKDIAQSTSAQTAASIPPPKAQPAPQKSSTPSSKPSTKERKPRKREVQAKSEETERYIGYLQQFHSAREQWHFNKGRQTALLKNLFNVFRVPEEYDDALSAYLAGLQGRAARDRLTQTANEILENTKDAVDSSDDVTMTDSIHKEARDAALKKQLKGAKGRLRDETAKEDSMSDDRLLLLRKRKRAELVIQGLGAGQPSMVVKLAASAENAEPEAKKKRTRRPNKSRTGVPDDDLSDDTSSVGSVPLSAGTDDESSSEEESDSSSSEDGDSSSDSSEKDGSESG
jgi:hypothetical protein